MIVYLKAHRRHPLTNWMGSDNEHVCIQSSYYLNYDSVKNKQLIYINFLTFPLLRNNSLYKNSLFSQFANDFILLLLNVT